jgi:ectoine hydroxylase-related dioxygenase (phytanoyl-CoA dioxygenase family)
VFVADALRNEVQKNGFAICEDVLPPEEITALLGALGKIGNLGSLQKRGATFAVRNLLDTSLEIRELAASEVVHRLVDAVLGPGSFGVRGILFDKIPHANWKVPWHQDVTIAIQEKVEAKGFGPWSTKADVLHVQPPAYVLEQMISVRLHLDPCGEANGALRVIPGSHLQGRIPEEKIARIREEVPERICAVRAGGALLMDPYYFTHHLHLGYQVTAESSI